MERSSRETAPREAGTSPSGPPGPDALETVVRALAEPQNRGMILHGPRWVGKTSTLQQLVHALATRSPHHAMYFDLQGRGGKPLAELLGDLAACVADALELPRPRPGADREAERWFRDQWLASILDELPPDVSLVLLFDELDGSPGAGPAQAASTLYPYLRTLVEAHAPRLRLVLALGRRGEDLEKIARACFAGIPVCRMSPLSDKPRVEQGAALHAATADGPHIEVRAPAAAAALGKSLEAETKARAEAEAQVAALVLERDRLVAEARISNAEVSRLGILLGTVTQERERLSADFMAVTAEPAPPPPPSPIEPGPPRPPLGSRSVPTRTMKDRLRWSRVLAGLALAGGGLAAAAFYAMQPTRLELDAAPLTLLDRTETAKVTATRVLRAGQRRPAAGAAWSSADPRVATVDALGVVTPAGTGRTRIEARDGALTSAVEVTVSLPARIALEPSELVLTPESADTAVKATILDGAGAPWKRRAELAWASSEPGVATLAGGKVHRVGLGDAVITASLGGLSGRLAVRSLDRRGAFEQACTAGGLEACVDLGHLLETGDEGPADAARALSLYERACEGGEMKGCIAAGAHHEGGRGGAPDIGKALAAYQKACAGRAFLGCTRLGRMYETVVHDAGKATALYRDACDGADADGCWRLGTLYELGGGVARDVTLAAALYTRACDGGRPEACTSLAHMFWNGSGSVARDMPGATALFEKGCAGKHDEACLFLALKYKAGDGVAEDPKKAQAFFWKACEAGHKGACVIAPRAPEP